MRTDRKHVMFHNVKRSCHNCSQYIYEDQSWMLIEVGFGRHEPYHTDYQGCMDSVFVPEIRIGTRKGRINE